MYNPVYLENGLIKDLMDKNPKFINTLNQAKKIELEQEQRNYYNVIMQFSEQEQILDKFDKK